MCGCRGEDYIEWSSILMVDLDLSRWAGLRHHHQRTSKGCKNADVILQKPHVHLRLAAS